MAKRANAGAWNRRRTSGPRAGARRKPQQHEKIEQAGGVKLLASIGSEVFVAGTRRPAGKPCPKCGTFVPEHQGTRQTPGIPDVFAFLPPREGRRVLLCWEAKAPDGGRERDGQKKFRELCEAADTAHCLGSLDDLIAWLIRHDYLRADNVPHYRLPKEPVCPAP